MSVDPKNPQNLIPHKELNGMSFYEYDIFLTKSFNYYKHPSKCSYKVSRTFWQDILLIFKKK